MRSRAVTIWLNADLDTLWKRVSKRGHRPLLKRSNPKQVLSELFEARQPIYELADITIESADGPHGDTVAAILKALKEWSMKADD